MSYGAFQALLSGVIDYAGTFPPAQLSLEDTLKRAASFRSDGHHPWLMGRLALKLSDIKKLSSELLFKSGADGSAWILTALGSPLEDKSPEEITRQIEWDIRELRHCDEKWFYSSVRQFVLGYEMKIPPEYLGESVLESTLDRLSHLKKFSIDPVFEISLEGDWKRTLSSVRTILSRWLAENEDLGLIPGLKVRTGGSTPASPEQLAAVIAACASSGLRFKATQGLHEAITHKGAFGFVNLFAAINLLFSYGEEEFPVKQVEACLLDESKASFSFSAKTFSWKKFSIQSDAIEAARRIHAACFGSCSLDEPDASLKKEFP